MVSLLSFQAFGCIFYFIKKKNSDPPIYMNCMNMYMNVYEKNTFQARDII